MDKKENPICEEKMPETLYRIGMFAGMNHVTIKTLRYYDEQELLKPAAIDVQTGYRYYKLGQMSQLHQIRALRNMGLRIDEIKKILDGTPEKQLLMRKRKQILLELASLTKKLAQIDQAIEEEYSPTSSHVLLKQIPEVVVATMRRRIKGYESLFDMMPEMGAEMERLGCVCAMPEYCFTLYPENEYKEEDILIEACEAVKEAKEDSEKIKFKTYPAIPMAACIFHKGSYNTLPQSYEKVLHYIEENNLTISDSIRENYIDGIWNKDSEEEWLTEIQVPVEKKESRYE